MVKISYTDLLDLSTASAGISALLAAALRTYDVSDQDKPQTIEALLDSLNGILMLAKSHSAHAFQLADTFDFIDTGDTTDT